MATTTVWSGASYIYTKDAVKILNQDEAGKKLDKVEEEATGLEEGTDHEKK